MLWGLSPSPWRISILQLTSSFFYIITSFLSTGSLSSAHTPARVSSVFKTATIMSITSLDLISSFSCRHLSAPLPCKGSQEKDLIYCLHFLSALSLFNSPVWHRAPPRLFSSSHQQCLYCWPNTVVNFQSWIFLSAALDIVDPFFLLKNFPLGFSSIRLSRFSSYLIKHVFSVSFADLSPLLDRYVLAAKSFVLGHFLCPLF